MGFGHKKMVSWYAFPGFRVGTRAITAQSLRARSLRTTCWERKPCPYGDSDYDSGYDNDNDDDYDNDYDNDNDNGYTFPFDQQDGININFS